MNDELATLRFDLLSALEEVLVDGQVLQSTLINRPPTLQAYEHACRFYYSLDHARRLALMICTASAVGAKGESPTLKERPTLKADNS
jgi:hypothetical protein